MLSRHIRRPSGPRLSSRFFAPGILIGECYGTSGLPNRSCRSAQCAVCRDFLQRGTRPGAGNLFAGTVTMWQAASLPEALRRLYGNWLLDCRICKKMRVSEGISGAVHLHKYMLDIEKVTVISDEMRAVVESECELVHKLPPRGSKTRGGKKWTFLRRILVLRSDATRMALGDTSWYAAPLAYHSGSTGGE